MDEFTQFCALGRVAFEMVLEALEHGAFELDAETLADHAVTLGLLEHVPYDPDKHGDIDCERGETIYWVPEEARGDA